MVKRTMKEEDPSGSKPERRPKRPTDSPSQPRTAKKPKVLPEGSESEVLKSSEGDTYVDLGKKKRATVRSFKGNVYVDIREFYGPDDDEKPGKKGISLSLEQWETLKSNMAAIDLLIVKQPK